MFAERAARNPDLTVVAITIDMHGHAGETKAAESGTLQLQERLLQIRRAIGRGGVQIVQLVAPTRHATGVVQLLRCLLQ